jgi:LytR cell envelope-related transcriptional attenuator
VHIVQDIGAYAGFAAVVGLAILSALYFSQARDVKRLRDWAGRAPERTAQQQAEVTARAATKPAAPPAAPAQPAPAKPTPAQQPAPATGGNAGKTAAPAPGKTPTPAQTPAPAPASGAAAAAKPAEAAVAQAAPVPAGAAAKPKTPAPKLPKRPTSPPSTPARTAVLPPTAKTRPGAPSARRWPAPRYIALIVVGVLVVGGGMAYGVSQLVKEDHPSTTPNAPGGGGGGGEKPAERPPINPSTITVSVLNGTTVSNLAAQFADKLEAEGFQRGNTANNTDQTKAESVVLYANGASRAARAVATRLKISQTEPIDAESQGLAGDATVVVVVGGDQTQ